MTIAFAVVTFQSLFAFGLTPPPHENQLASQAPSIRNTSSSAQAFVPIHHAAVVGLFNHQYGCCPLIMDSSSTSEFLMRAFPNSCHTDEAEVTWEMMLSVPPPPSHASLLPLVLPCEIDPADEFFASNCVYVGNGVSPSQRLGSSARAAWGRISISFDQSIEPFFAAMLDEVPSTVVPLYAQPSEQNPKDDYARELVRQSMASYSRFSGLCVEEVNTGSTVTVNATPVRNLVFATGAYPISSGATLQINTNLLDIERGGGLPDATATGKILRRWSDEFRVLRNVILHEFGHCIGLRHAAPTDRTKMMESPVPTQFEGISMYERRAIARTYGDLNSFLMNTEPARAADFKNLSLQKQSVLARDMSINCSPISSSAPEDWYKFEIADSVPVRIEANPTGGSYWHAPQITPTGSFVKFREAEKAANLRLALYQDVNGTLQLVEDVSTGLVGETKTIDRTTTLLPSGTYYVMVTGIDPCSAWVNDNEMVQTYDLSIRVSDYTVPPRAIAGLRQRLAELNEPSYFLGHINSRAMEPGTDIVLYQWDLDGDGDIDVTRGYPKTLEPMNSRRV